MYGRVDVFGPPLCHNADGFSELFSSLLALFFEITLSRYTSGINKLFFILQ